MKPLSTPLVSIVTPVRNGADTISNTLASVRGQQGVDYEHIVIDGASSDGTTGILSSFPGARLRWISEPDLGIYDAMNKGISLARGEWLLFLGADDVLSDQVVLSDIFQQQELIGYDLVCGRSSYENGKECKPRLDWHTQIFNTVHHQAAFYRKHLFSDFRYRVDIPVIADYEMNFRIYHQRRPVLFLDRKVVVSGDYGVSQTTSQLSSQIDAYRIRSRYINAFRNTSLLAAGLGNLLLARLMRRRPYRFRP